MESILTKRNTEISEKVKEIWRINQLTLEIPLIDLQHVWLISLLVKLEIILEDRNSNLLEFELKGIISEIVRFTLDHFCLEEHLFKTFHYSEEKAHKEQHRKFIKNFELSVNQNFYESKELAQKILKMIENWLFHHILIEDKKYLDFIHKNRSKVDHFFKEIQNQKSIISIFPEQMELYKSVTGNVIEISRENASILEDTLKIWKTYKLKVNIPLIDLQHLWLIKTTFELDHLNKTSVSADRDNAFRQGILIAINYTKEHFRIEEAIFEKFIPEKFHSHQLQHLSFIDSISQRNLQNKQGHIVAFSNLIGDLKEWLISHIAIDDGELRKISKDNKSEIEKLFYDWRLEGKIIISTEQKEFYEMIKMRSNELN